MNTLLTEEVQKLREAFDRGAGVRAAAREVNINRETCAKYFREWQQAVPSDPTERVKHFRLIADMEEWFLKLKPDRAAVLRAAFYAGIAKRPEVQSR